jgi:hypothetical protein
MITPIDIALDKHPSLAWVKGMACFLHILEDPYVSFFYRVKTANTFCGYN